MIHEITALQEEIGEFARDVQRVRDVALTTPTCRLRGGRDPSPTQDQPHAKAQLD
jgi:hypothetical protein